MLSGVRDECTPAATDVEETVTLLEVKLLRYEVKLLVLSCLEIFVTGLEEGRRIDHAIAKECAEKVIAAVVVIANDALVLRLRVDHDLRDELGQQKLYVVTYKIVVEEQRAVLEELLHVACDVNAAVHVVFNECRDGDLYAILVTGSDLLVLYDDYIGDILRLNHRKLFV
jgi:hypothetical protein